MKNRLVGYEQEKVFIIQEKEKRERDCRNMQVELNRMNSYINVSHHHHSQSSLMFILLLELQKPIRRHGVQQPTCPYLWNDSEQQGPVREQLAKHAGKTSFQKLRSIKFATKKRTVWQQCSNAGYIELVWDASKFPRATVVAAKSINAEIATSLIQRLLSY